MLKFDGQWRYRSPGEMPADVVADLLALVMRIATQDASAQNVYEIFKRRFAQAAGRQTSRSSSEAWAKADMKDYAGHASENAALFVEAFYDACADIEHHNESIVLPPLDHINRILQPSGYAIAPPDLVMGQISAGVAVPGHTPSLDEQANELIQTSLLQSEDLLAAGQYRAAVSEIFWLLETVSTAFRGAAYAGGNVTGNYFNQIVDDLKRLNHGGVLGQVMTWMKTLHGFVSSPTGGGIRHGTDLKEGTELGAAEARLYCDLTRSYIAYLLAEHARLHGA
ncbi:hypothetical protein [Burkholderia vietnamiensis]|uniref:hypothetical protein n=1 Tax=Burkholderia vietnamiensis TaxID=60552 RepID=UPI00265158F9|nr:hypothetical protein [Burkholderia vietnamiensis]MDN8039283.1 hypothetical protein [Burkholderia vietnamiensis]